MSCRIAHAGQLSESFEVKAGVRQGCLLSPFLFLVIYWIMKITTGRNNGIQWTLWTQLDDLDFADDLALLSHNHSQMLDKTSLLELPTHQSCGEPIMEVESFDYLGSVTNREAQTGTSQPESARQEQLSSCSNIWASGGISMRTKLPIFNSSVKSVLLYGCETRHTTDDATKDPHIQHWSEAHLQSPMARKDPK